MDFNLDINFSEFLWVLFVKESLFKKSIFQGLGNLKLKNQALNNLQANYKNLALIKDMYNENNKKKLHILVG